MLSSLLCRYQRSATSHFGSRLFSSRSTIPAVRQDDSTVSYLVHSCGLSPEAATEASHKVKLRSLEKADSVLALLRRYEFSDTQISDIVRKYPILLLSNAHKTILPKLEFLSSIGMSSIDLATMVSYNPNLLHRSLRNVIVPCYINLKGLGISDANVLSIIRRNSGVLWRWPWVNVKANIRLVTELGMPSNCIAYLVAYYNILAREQKVFSQIVSNVKGMGFDPGKMSFVHAMAVLAWKKAARRAKEDVFKRWGWSESDIHSAFRMFPQCMYVSEKKIMAVMEVIVNKMGWESGKVAEYPYILSFSLEKRIIPRCSVIRVLLLKGLIEEKTLTLASISSYPDDVFLSRYVTRYRHLVPQLLNVYQQKADV